MIEEIKIDGTLYKAVDNPYYKYLACLNCDLIEFCRINRSFIRACTYINNNTFYKKQ